MKEHNMWNNPEFKRNLWLEFSFHRLVAAPLLLAILLVVVAMQTDINGNAWESVVTAAFIVFLLTCTVWGTSLAIDSVSDEIRNRTWDNQRLSTLSPFKLVWGKLFGATAFAWYIGLPCLLVIVMARGHVATSSHFGDTWLMASALLTGTLLMQSLGLLSALVGLKANAVAPKAVQLALLFFTLMAFGPLADISRMTAQSAWYGLKMPTQQMMIFSFILFTGWIWLACYRNMQAALQIRIKPWAMVVFVLFCAFYITGFIENAQHDMPASVILMYLTPLLAIVGVYFGAFSEKRDWVSIRRFFKSWRTGSTGYALQDTPYFIALAVFAFFTLIPAIVLTTITAAEQPGLLLPVAFVLMLKDVGLLYYFSLSKKPARATVTTLFYLLLIYGLIPALFKNSTVSLLFNPLSYLLQAEASFYIAFMTALVHLLVVAFLLYKRYKSISQQL
ncbi:MAG: hypothetical protein WBP13_01440 [Methylophilaceae bacterium]